MHNVDESHPKIRKGLPVSLSRSFSRLSSGLWFRSLVCWLASGYLSARLRSTRRFDYELVPRSISGGPDAAMEILSTVAASMVSLAALVLTITMVVVQLAMGQFSPRIVQRILEDKPSQLAIGIFVGTFAHAMLALRDVQTEGEGVVPGVDLRYLRHAILVAKNTTYIPCRSRAAAGVKERIAAGRKHTSGCRTSTGLRR